MTYYADGTTPPDKPDIPETGKGLRILKVKAGTTQGLSGAVFRLTDADGGIIGEYVTDVGLEFAKASP